MRCFRSYKKDPGAEFVFRHWDCTLYMKRLFNSDPALYADKMRMTNNVDEILQATEDWVNEGTKHPRKDTIKDFARGNVLVRVGQRDYSADVVIGIKKDGTMVLYDVLKLKPTSIKEKSQTQDNTANVREELRDRGLASDGNTIADKAEKGKGDVAHSYDEEAGGGGQAAEDEAGAAAEEPEL